MDNCMAVINDVWKWFHKFHDRDKTDDSYWEDVVHESEEIMKKNKSSRYVRIVLLAWMNELSSIKDWGLRKADIKIYYNVFLDCSRLVKAAPNGFDSCNQLAKDLYGKYNKLEVATNMIDATLEEVAKGGK